MAFGVKSTFRTLVFRPELDIIGERVEVALSIIVSYQLRIVFRLHLLDFELDDVSFLLTLMTESAFLTKK